jgi:hypothetical protein
MLNLVQHDVINLDAELNLGWLNLFPFNFKSISVV